MRRYEGKTEFVIDTSEWDRGNSSTRLLSKRNKIKGDKLSCCVGLYMKACGVSDKRLLGKMTLYSLFEGTFFRESLSFFKDYGLNNEIGQVWRKLYRTNDSMLITDYQRKKKIKKLFAKLGIKVSFK